MASNLRTWTVLIHAAERWNNTGIVVSRSRRYLIEAAGSWVDSTIETEADGYSLDELGRFQRYVLRLGSRWRRMRGARYFALIGAIDQRDATQFVIGRRYNGSPPADGELTCFANDLWLMYRNNSGAVQLTVTEQE